MKNKILLIILFLNFNIFAACNADINLGGNKITNAIMSDDSTLSEVATKSYVDATTQNSLKYATNCVFESSGKSYLAAAGVCAANNSYLPRDVLEMQIAGCTTIKGWLSFSLPSGEILVNNGKNNGDFLTQNYIVDDGGYEIKTSGTTQFNCVK
jgi:predicted small secreted protein